MVSQKCFELSFLGYRTIIARCVAKCGHRIVVRSCVKLSTKGGQRTILGQCKSPWKGIARYGVSCFSRRISTLLESSSPIFRQREMLSLARFGPFPEKKMAAGNRPRLWERSWIFSSETATAFLSFSEYHCNTIARYGAIKVPTHCTMIVVSHDIGHWQRTPYHPRRNYIELILERAGPVIFKASLLELMAFWKIPVMCPARRARHENYWKRQLIPDRA